MHLAGALLLALATQAPDDPGSALLDAIRAVETGGARATRDAWTSAARAGSLEAVLGLAALNWLTYDTVAAGARLRTLVEDPGEASRDLQGWAWLAYGDALVARGEFRRADDAFARGLDLVDAAVDPRAAAWALLGRAGTRARLQGTAAGLAFLERADSLTAPDDTYLRARLLCVRAGLEPTPIEEVEARVREGIRLAEAAAIRRAGAACRAALASRRIRVGDTDGAAAELRRAAQEQEAARDLAGLAATRQWLGYFLRVTGNLGYARVLLLEAVAAGEASGNLSPVAWAHVNLASLLVAMAEVEEARRHAEEAERLLDAQGDRWGFAAVREVQALIEILAGRDESARALMADAMEVFEPEGNVPGILGIHSLRFKLAMAAGDLDEAAGILEESRNVTRGLPPGGWGTFLNLQDAWLAIRRGRPAEAEAALERLWAVPLNPGQLFPSLALYAEAAVLQKQPEEAVRRLARAFEALESWQGAADDPELLRHLFQLSEGRAHDPDVSVTTVVAAAAESGLVAEAYHLAERRRARALLHAMLQARGAQTTPSKLAQPTGLMGWISRLPAVLTASELAERLPDEATAVLTYVWGRGGGSITAFLLTHDGLRSLRLDAGPALAQEVTRLVALAESGGDVAPVARRLGESLVAPVLAEVPPHIGSLVVIPDGALHALPFDVLRVEDRPLVESLAVSVAPSGSVAALVWGRPQPGDRVPALLALGDPRFPGEVQADPGAAVLRSAFEGNGGLPRLRGSRREARTVARYAPGADVRLRASASEAGLKRDGLSDYRVIHLATHALVDPGRPARTALALAPGGGEDGFLVPAEILELDLDADLVVLSACRTAGGRVVQGEGIQGLTAPMLQAGARAVVATSWQIPDRAVAPLMEDFYRGLARGLPAAEALREAKDSARRRGEPAAVWAAFTLVGDGSVRIPLRQPHRRPGRPVFLSGLAVLALAGAAAWRWGRSSP